MNELQQPQKVQKMRKTWIPTLAPTLEQEQTQTETKGKMKNDRDVVDDEK